MVHQFLQTGTSTFELNQSAVCDILVVAGGGGGGNSVPYVCGGGGGAGGFQYFTGQSLSAGSYTVTVGDGGAIQTIGNNSQFGSLIASIGGGAGSSGSGGNGGSGGGGGTNSGGGTGTVGQGNSGGVSSNNGGGGGGAGAAGTTTSGGIGLQNNITGTSIYYAGGGGGGYYGGSTTLPGGLGGGGLGGAANATNNTAGISNTGGGGGGNGNAQAGTRGGSGIVIVRYPVGPTPTIINGSLEIPALTYSVLVTYTPSNITNWTFTGTNSGIVTASSLGSLLCNTGVPAVTGYQALWIQYGGSSAGKATTTISGLTYGFQYTLGYFYARRTGNVNVNHTVALNGNVIKVYQNAIGSDVAWTYDSYSFIATNTTMNLAITAGVTATTDQTMVFDNFTVTAIDSSNVPTTVPTIPNPSFELYSGVFGSGLDYSFDVGVTGSYLLNGWTITVPTQANGGNIAVMRNTGTGYSPWNSTITSQDGINALQFLTGVSTPNPSISTTITGLVFGQIYTIKVYLANLSTNVGMAFNFKVNNTNANTLTTTPSSSVFAQYSVLTFMASSTSHVLTITATNNPGSGSFNAFMDNLTISASNTFGQLGTLSASAISSMKGAYSLRLLLSTYTGPVVQLSNGTTNMNGYADASGVLWTSSTLSGQTLQSWLGASTGYIKTLYDQSGNGSHVAQATQGNCPTINFTSSPPTMTFTSANSQYLKVTPGLLNGQSTYTYFAIWNAATTGGFNVCDENVNNTGNTANVRASLLVTSNSTYGFCGESNDSQSIAPYSINTRINTIMRVNNGANPNIKIRSNGTDYTGATGNPSTLSVSNGAFGIGLKLSLTNEFFNGTISHVVVFNINLSDADTSFLATL